MRLLRKTGVSAPHQPASSTEIREHLANERTLLSWVRTGVGLISVGFIVERSGAIASGASSGARSLPAAEIFGLALVALGCVTLVMGSLQFFRNRRMISEGVFASKLAPYLVVVSGSMLLAVAFIAYVLLS